MNIFLDMDGVICTEEKTFERSLAQPIEGAKEGIAALRSQGHKVIVYSARSWSELEMTKVWLERFGIIVDGIHLGKPVGDIWIDDRAIRFDGWGNIIEGLTSVHKSKPLFEDSDLFHLSTLRKATAEFLEKIPSHKRLFGPILEIGPMTLSGSNSKVHDYLPDTFVNSRELFENAGFEYFSVDSDPTANPDFCCSITEPPSSLMKNQFGAIIILSVLEHIPDVFKLPRILADMIAPGGYIFAVTPWNLRFHGPRPDCWRISDDGYYALFGDLFDMVSIDKIPCEGRPLSPVGLKVIMQKPF